MKPKLIGDKLVKARLERGFSVDQVVQETKIRRIFIEAMENEKFDVFKSHVYAKGFLKNYSKYLKLDPDQLIAVYRRDYENFKITRIRPKPEEEENAETKVNRFKLPNITSKKIVLLGFVLFVVLVIFLLLSLINRAFEKPFLKISYPIEINTGEEKTIDYFDSTVVIKGETTSNVVIKINEVPVDTRSDFTFESGTIPVTSETNNFVITATNQLGISSQLKLQIVKKEKQQENNNSIEGYINVTGSKTNLYLITDGVDYFNSDVYLNDSFPVKANTTLEIKSENPNYFVIMLNGQEYNLISTDDVFSLENGSIVRVNGVSI